MFQKGVRKKIYQSTLRVRSATNEDSPFFPRQPCGTRIRGVSVAKRVDVSGLLREFCKGWMSGKGCLRPYDRTERQRRLRREHEAAFFEVLACPRDSQPLFRRTSDDGVLRILLHHRRIWLCKAAAPLGRLHFPSSLFFFVLLASYRWVLDLRFFSLPGHVGGPSSHTDFHRTVPWNFTCTGFLSGLFRPFMKIENARCRGILAAIMYHRVCTSLFVIFLIYLLVSFCSLFFLRKLCKKYSVYNMKVKGRRFIFVLSFTLTVDKHWILSSR